MRRQSSSRIDLEHVGSRLRSKSIGIFSLLNAFAAYGVLAKSFRTYELLAL